MGSEPTEVLVVGAGPMGLTIASQLAARGVGCRIIDATPERSETSRALRAYLQSVFLTTAPTGTRKT